MAAILKSPIGGINLLASNPRTIRDSAFSTLCESIERDPEFLMARGVVVWQVPTALDIPEGGKSPFAGQEGKLVVIGGNQRCKAFVALGKTELKKEWMVEAKDENGNWWSPEKAERFVLLDNNPAGIAGENDTKVMFERFSEMSMRLTGIDFSEFADMMAKPDAYSSVESEVEEGPGGEKDPALKEFIEHREAVRKGLKEINAAGFHLLLVFDSFEEKCEFIAKAGLTGDKKRVAVNATEYVDLVFETFDQKLDFAEAAGLLDGESEDGTEDGRLMFGMFCDGRVLARRMGIELKASGLHFPDRRVDSALADLARPVPAERSAKEIDEGMLAEIQAGLQEEEEAVAEAESHPREHNEDVEGEGA